jgi:hypothetical protein
MRSGRGITRTLLLVLLLLWPLLLGAALGGLGTTLTMPSPLAAAPAPAAGPFAAGCPADASSPGLPVAEDGPPCC